MKGVFISNNFFKPDIFENLYSDMDLIFDEKVNLIKNTTWTDSVVEYSKPISIKPLNHNPELYHSVKNTVYELTGRHPNGIYYYFWGPGSYIPWHNDEIYSSAISIYMNKNWNFIDGGLFQYYQNGKVETIIPEGNTAVMQTGNVPHSTTILSRHAPIRKSIQIWFEKDNDIPLKSTI